MHEMEVSEMNMPGFTAEAALSQTSGRYQMSASADTALFQQSVTPALPINPGWWLRCIGACTACALAGGVGPNCWVCRNCYIIVTSSTVSR